MYCTTINFFIINKFKRIFRQSELPELKWAVSGGRGGEHMCVCASVCVQVCLHAHDFLCLLSCSSPLLPTVNSLLMWETSALHLCTPQRDGEFSKESLGNTDCPWQVSSVQQPPRPLRCPWTESVHLCWAARLHVERTPSGQGRLF